MEELNLLFNGIVWFKEVITAMSLFMVHVWLAIGGGGMDEHLGLECLDAIQRVIDYIFNAMEADAEWVFDYLSYLAQRMRVL